MPLGKDGYALHLRLQIRGEAGTVYGSGVSELLQRCENTRSLHGAAKEMRMPYRKALAIVKRAEEGFGQPILEKTIGGVGGGGSRLTPFGRELLDGFRALERETAAFARERMAQLLPCVAGSDRERDPGEKEPESQ